MLVQVCRYVHLRIIESIPKAQYVTEVFSNTGTHKSRKPPFNRKDNKMKYLLISIFVATQILSASEYPKMDTVSGRSPRYMYIYPEVITPTCSPWRNEHMAQWRKEKTEDILVEDAQNALFYTSFEKIAKKNKAHVYDSTGICSLTANSLGLSRTVLNMTVFKCIKNAVIFE